VQGKSIFYGCNDTLNMTSKELNEIQAKASKGWIMHKFFFYLKPKNFLNSLWPKFKTLADLRYSFSVLWMLMGRNIKEMFKKNS